MDPNQQPAPPAGGFNPGQYDFITNPPKAPKPSLLGSLTGGNKTKLLIMAIAVLTIITILVVVVSSFFGGSSNKDRLVAIAQQQSELARVAQLGTDSATGTNAKSLAASVQLTMVSDKAALNELLVKNGDKVKEKDLIGTPDSETDTKLTTAQQNGTFDTIFTSTMKELLNDYKNDLSNTFDTSTGQLTKQTLAQAYENATILIDDHAKN